jgi:large subunit ribosomal protein L13e
MKHNNEIPNNHFRKEWDLRVRTWFDQPARKLRRRKARAAKAARAAPRPADGLLRPIVRCQTLKYNSRARLGRGFSAAELKEAGIAVRLAPTIGIAVDLRRRNRAVEGMQAKVQRLKEYQSKLIVFPRVPGKLKAGDSDAAATGVAAQLSKGALLPLEKPAASVTVEPLTEAMKSKNAYRSLRMEHTNGRYRGIRAVRAAAQLEEDEEKAKK